MLKSYYFSYFSYLSVFRSRLISFLLVPGPQAEDCSTVICRCRQLSVRSFDVTQLFDLELEDLELAFQVVTHPYTPSFNEVFS